MLFKAASLLVSAAFWFGAAARVLAAVSFCAAIVPDAFVVVDRLVEDVPYYNSLTALAGTTYTAYTIGLISGSAVSYFDLKAYARRAGTANTRVYSIRFQVSGTSTAGEAGSVGDLDVVVDYDTTTGGTLPTVTFGLSIVSNKAVLTYNSNFDLFSISFSGLSRMGDVETTDAPLVYYS